MSFKLDFPKGQTRVTLDAARTISTTGIAVRGIILANGTGSAVTVSVKDGAASNTILSVTVPANATQEVQSPFYAASGLSIASASSASVIATVFYVSE